MSHSVSSEKSTTVRLSFPPALITAPLRFAPFLQRPVLSRLFFSPLTRRTETASSVGAPIARIRVADKRVIVRARGRGPTVLLVHGWQGSASDLWDIADAVVHAGFTVVTCDMPAHGETEGTTTSVGEFIEAILGIARLVGPLHAVVGHSLGGTATALAVARGLSVQGAVLVSPMVSFDFALDEFARTLNLSPELREVTARAAEERVGFTRADANLATQQVPDVPLLVFHDRNDRRTPYQHSVELTSKWATSTLVTTERLGHRRILGDEYVLGTIAKFVRDLPRSVQNPLDFGVVPELFDADS